MDGNVHWILKWMGTSGSPNICHSNIQRMCVYLCTYFVAVFFHAGLIIGHFLQTNRFSEFVALYTLLYSPESSLLNYIIFLNKYGRWFPKADVQVLTTHLYSKKKKRSDILKEATLLTSQQTSCNHCSDYRQEIPIESVCATRHSPYKTPFHSGNKSLYLPNSTSAEYLRRCSACRRNWLVL